MRKLVVFVLALALLGVAPTTSFAQPSCGDTITTSTTLTTDLVCSGNGLRVSGSNVTLDLGGHTIRGLSGSSFSTTGVYSIEADHPIVMNGEIEGFDYGLHGSRTTSGLFNRLLIDGNRIGVALEHGTYTLTRNRIVWNTELGLVTDYTATVTLIGNKIKHNGPKSKHGGQ
jgi:hypothetical protein